MSIDRLVVEVLLFQAIELILACVLLCSHSGAQQNCGVLKSSFVGGGLEN